MRERVVLDSTRHVRAGDEYTFCDSNLSSHTVRGPGTFHVSMVEFGERRTATTQRRVRWVLGGRREDPARRTTSLSGAGRRANDVADHEEHRFTTNVLRAEFFHRRKGDERRREASSSWKNYRRRKGDERRTHINHRYKTSFDPRIRALERRKQEPI